MSSLAQQAPTAAESQMLRFAVSLPNLRTRWLLAGALFTAGIAVWCLVPPIRYLGLLVVLLGHVPLWVRSQTTAPGGATPAHEEIWAPVEEEWTSRLDELEEKGRRWDATPWDFSNRAGCLGLLAVLAAIALLALGTAALAGRQNASLLGYGAAALLVPLWLNGARSTWNPSELRLKAEALATARACLEHEPHDDLEPIPMLALREGKHGKYPVDAKLMVRPKADDGTGFLGIQLQVAINNVQGKDYPYLYAVVLGRDGFLLPRAAPHSGRSHGVISERGEEGDVSYLVIRRYADRSGGWLTEWEQIREIVGRALAEGREAWQKNRDRNPREPGA